VNSCQTSGDFRRRIPSAVVGTDQRVRSVAGDKDNYHLYYSVYIEEKQIATYYRSRANA